MSSSLTLSAVSFGWPRSPALFEGLNLTLSPGLDRPRRPRTARASPRCSASSRAQSAPSAARSPCDQRRGGHPVRPRGRAARSRSCSGLRRARDSRGAGPAGAAPAPVGRARGAGSTLSVGERRRWQLAAALWSEPDVLLLDEPSDPLDDAGRGLLLSALRRHRGVGVLVSHDRALLDALCGVTLRVTPGQVRRFDEPYTAAAARWRAEEAAERQRWEEDARRLKRAEHRHDQARRDREAADHQVSARVRMKGPKDSDARGILARGRAEMGATAQAKRTAAARRRVEGLAETLARPPAAEPLGAALRLGGVSAPMERLLSLHLASVKVAGEALDGPVALSLHREDRVWLRGPNGAGKTTLLCALAEASRLPPERLFVLPQTFTEAEVQALLAEAHTLNAEARGRLGHRLAALGVPPERVWSSARPSPGEARKLSLALALHRRFG
jgi:ATPase subunit of ABC transporter with duplicated ATPase domains